MHARRILLVSALTTTSGCFPWGSRAEHRLPTQTALDRDYDYGGKVIVVGAGAAGLAAARVLEDNDVDYSVLEATSRFGGRLGKDDTFADFPLDLGAEWIHNRAEILDVLSGEEGGAESIELIPYRLDEVVFWDGAEMRDVSAEFDRQARFFPEFKFKGSTWYDFASEHYGRRVEHRIHYNAPVVSIDYTGDRVRVTTQQGAVYFADKVIVTVSVGVLTSGALAFTPALSEKKRSALESVDFHPGFKAFLRFTEDFYPDAIACEVKEGEKVFFDAAFGKEAEAHVLGALVVGPSAIEYTALPTDEARADALIRELDLMFEGRASQAYTGEFLLVDWGQRPHVLGTWVEGFRLGRRTVKTLNEPLDDKVFFAGEVYDTYHQLGVPGAMLSGMHAVDLMLRRASD